MHKIRRATYRRAHDCLVAERAILYTMTGLRDLDLSGLCRVQVNINLIKYEGG
jgi:hypothetical protein